jgi:hypothetical protein
VQWSRYLLDEGKAKVLKQLLYQSKQLFLFHKPILLSSNQLKYFKIRTDTRNEDVKEDVEVMELWMFQFEDQNLPKELYIEKGIYYL